MTTPRKRATAIVLRGGSVLLVRDSGGRSFSLPGGGIEPDELPVSAVIRELREETGLEARKVEFLFAHLGKANEHSVFLVEAAGEVRPSREVGAFLWWNGRDPVSANLHVHDILHTYHSLARPTVTKPTPPHKTHQ